MLAGMCFGPVECEKLNCLVEIRKASKFVSHFIQLQAYVTIVSSM